MSYQNLTTGGQAIANFNFEMFIKFVMVGFLFFFCVYYLTNMVKKQKETSLYTIAFTRMILFGLSWAVIMLSPIGIWIFLNPALDFASFLVYMLVPYLTILLLLLFLLVIDALYLGPQIMLSVGGMDIRNPKVQRAVASLKKYVKKIR